MVYRKPIKLVGVAALTCMNAAIAGPPMVTDDAGTAAPGILEIIVYVSHEERRSGESTEGPASLMVFDPDGNPILIDQHR